jgi:hypothetical protein
MNGQVDAYECNVVGTEWQKIVNARSAGKAKAEYHRDVRDAWSEIPFTAIRARKLKRGAHSSPEFLSVAQRRGLPHVRCGDRVMVGDDSGVIVGHNGSMNFDVLFDGGRYAGQVLNVHPGSCRFDEQAVAKDSDESGAPDHPNVGGVLSDRETERR